MVRMNKTRKKNLKRMIHTTRSRFFSLTAIVAIGVAFFLGLVSSGTVMSYSVQVYDDELNLKDITVYSNYGFDEDDIDAVKVLDEVADAEGTKFADVYAASGSSIRVTRVHAYNPDDTINQFQLREGRLPENEHEALAEAGTDGTSGFAIGSTVTLSRPSDDLSIRRCISMRPRRAAPSATRRSARICMCWNPVFPWTMTRSSMS